MRLSTGRRPECYYLFEGVNGRDYSEHMRVVTKAVVTIRTRTLGSATIISTARA